MKRTVITYLFFVFSLSTIAQDYRNIFIGRYAGIEKQTNTPGNTFYDYNALAEIVYGDSSTQRIFFIDSCAWMNWSGATGNQKAMADSTIRAMGNLSYIYGQLFSNDSLYFTWSDMFGSTLSKEEFFGFKLYSTVGVKDLSKPENELLLSPQPACDLMYIQSTQVLFIEQKTPTFYDMNGRKIEASTQYVNSNTYKVDVSNLEEGMCVMELETNKGIVRKKIIVAK